MSTDKKFVLVTTEFRGVFAGYMESREDRIVTLSSARNCIYWSEDMRGFLGLATMGPSDSCRIGSVSESVTLFGVTSITDCTDSACKKWGAA